MLPVRFLTCALLALAVVADVRLSFSVRLGSCGRYWRDTIHVEELLR
jgi:hypothetical protein